MNCSINHSLDNVNNGLITKIWGGPGWVFNHSITFGYPVEPSVDQKNQYRNYFISMGDVLPCKYCRESYKKFITTGPTALTDKALESRYTLTKWLYDVHQAVNKKLEIDYNVSYVDVVEKYESFRAKCGNSKDKGCVAPLDYKAFSFKKFYCCDPPFVSLEKIYPFIKIAIIRRVEKPYTNFPTIFSQSDIDKLKKEQLWQERNKICQSIIKYMRENAIPSIEEDGEWKGTPTIYELMLLMLLSSNLNQTQLDEAIYRVKQYQL